MEVFRTGRIDWEPADPAHFTGSARLRRVSWTTADPRARIFRVQFEPAARTNWHTHSGPQLLFVIEGRCRVQKAGDPSLDVEAGDVVRIAPGEKHWHGAAPGSRMTHIAVNIDATTTWLGAVTQAEFAPA